MLQLPSNSARNLHSNSAGRAGVRASPLHAHPGVTNGTQPRDPNLASLAAALLCWPPWFAPALHRVVAPKRSVEAHGLAPGIAQQWTTHLLLPSNPARCHCTSWLGKHSSQHGGTDPKIPGAHRPRSKPLGNCGCVGNTGWMTATIHLLRDCMGLSHGEASPRLPTAPAEPATCSGGAGGGFIVWPCTLQ